MFYKFDQNNSGGSFDYNKNISAQVIIEAKNSKEADRKAKEIGIYFNGVEDGFDCECCGDRWYGCTEHKTLDDASKYLSDYIVRSRGCYYHTVIHLMDGSVQYK